MAMNPINDLARQISAMMGQHQVLAGSIDRLVVGVGDFSKDLRAGFRAVDTKIDALRAEMNDHFRLVGSRFDKTDQCLSRFENGMRELHSDMLRLQSEIHTPQSSLKARRRLDRDAQGGEEPTP
ncbi:MAG TPA: hypothetical protein VF744_02720 [Beijerinckiaceae bacterium]|jgi:hypothetical protein